MSGSARLLADLEPAWQPLKEAVAAIGVEGLDRETSSGWTVKELIAHLAFWDEAVEGFVTTVLRQEPLAEGFEFGSGYEPGAEWPSADVHNAREAAWAREQSAADVLARWERAHDRLVRFLETVTDEEATEHADYFRSHIPDHFNEHLDELLEVAGAAD